MKVYKVDYETYGAIGTEYMSSYKESAWVIAGSPHDARHIVKDERPDSKDVLGNPLSSTKILWVKEQDITEEEIKATDLCVFERYKEELGDTGR